MKVKCLRAMAEKEISANGRNWLLTSALETEGFKIAVSETGKKNHIYRTSLEKLFMNFSVMVDPAKTVDVEMVAHFNFTDLGEDFVLRVNN